MSRTLARRATVATIAAKAVALIFVLSSLSWGSALSRTESYLAFEMYAPLALFFLLSMVAVAGTIVVPFLQNPVLRVAFATLIVAGTGLNTVIEAISGQRLDQWFAATLWRERAMAGGAFDAYWASAIEGVWWVFPTWLVFVWPPRFVSLRLQWAASPLAGAVLCPVLAIKLLSGTQAYPSPFHVPALFVQAAFNPLYDGPRSALVSPPASGGYDKIVMIVDESVRGDMLGINDARHPTTPFLGAMGSRLVNFGAAVSAHNCSAMARLIMRVGIQPGSLPDVEQQALRMPTIWQFAKQAGYHTALVDAFPKVFASHSYMSRDELRSVDQQISIGGDPAYNRDMDIAERVLPDLLNTEGRTFVYINKYGAHFPYADKYPTDFPTGATAPRDDLDDRTALVDSYERAVRWSVDEFFRRLSQHADLSRTLVIYTSDHGQSLLDGGYKLTHCSHGGAIARGEGIVPIFALPGDGFLGPEMHAAAVRSPKAWHFDLFPTLLIAMGYPHNWIAMNYGEASLLGIPTDRKRRFFVGGMFGEDSRARWISVD